jgi:hypothetical protein
VQNNITDLRAITMHDNNAIAISHEAGKALGGIGGDALLSVSSGLAFALKRIAAESYHDCFATH